MERMALVPFKRAIGEYERLFCSSLPVDKCSVLVRACRDFGVEGYCLADISGSGYLNRFMRYESHQVPTLIFRREFLVPLLFRNDTASQRLFQEPRRLQSFFILLDWYLTHKPNEVIVGTRSGATTLNRRGQLIHGMDQKIVDTAFLVFRLTEIIDASGLPLSQIRSVEEFTLWNRQAKLIDRGGGVGRHSRIFDIGDPLDQAHLKMVMTIIRLHYPFAIDFLPEKRRAVLSVGMFIDLSL